MIDDFTRQMNRLVCAVQSHEWGDWMSAEKMRPNPHHRWCHRCGKFDQEIRYD